MNRVPIRLDDFPHGSRDLYNTKNHFEWLYIAKDAVLPFEIYQIPYLLGVSLELLQPGDIDWLNKNIISGKVVMHGFNHYWDWGGDWNHEIQETWPLGGEFYNKSFSEILSLYTKAHEILLHVNQYDPEWFIPPFNTYNQALLDALENTSVKYLTSVDTFRKDYEYEKLSHKKLELIEGIYDLSYASVNIVLENLSKIDPKTQITLHWIFDSLAFDWEEKYWLFAKTLFEEIIVK